MVWIQFDNDDLEGLKLPWMDEKVHLTTNGKANVPESIADRLIDERPDVSRVETETADESEENDADA